MVGRTIAHYQIQEKLGEGGMGVVYRALDTHLDRPVAIKVLAADAVANPERKRRFVQEAKAASALNHPNIITIYDIDNADGVDFIAMEYVAGKTLDHLIARQGLPLGELLPYAIQIADALDRAHAAGIVHRDLKPANVMVTADGLVKVLDFGLAKLTETLEDDPLAPTRTLKLEEAPRTEEGTVVGTFVYMSPEQAEGRKVDARSDIFSFGSVLYEMTTGRRAFYGDTKISTLSAILRDEPKPVSELAADTPRELERVISLCLKKDPRRRFQHMDDIRVALEALKEESDSGKLPAATAGKQTTRQAKRRTPALAIAAAVVLGAAGTWWFTRSPKPTPASVPLTRLTSDSGLTYQPALSPDGQLLAYASDRSSEGHLDIWVQQIGGGQPIRLTRDPADEHDPAFSPDGRSIAFRSERAGGGIYVVPALGGDPRLIAERGQRPRFSPDGNEIAYFVGDGSFYAQTHIVVSTGGQPRPFQGDFTVASHPVWSPDGKHLLFSGRRRERSSAISDWWVAPVTGGPAVQTGVVAVLSRRGMNAIPEVWRRDGNFVLFSAQTGDSKNIWRIPISPDTGKVAGDPERVTSGAGREDFPSVTAGHRMAFSSLNSQIDVWSLPVDTSSGKVSGDLQRLTNDVAADTRPSISHDGKKLVFLSDRSGNNDVWLKDLEAGK